MALDIQSIIIKGLTGLVKQIKAVRYYPAGHPALLAAAEESLHGLRPLLEGSEKFSLVVRKEAFLYDDQPVSRNQQLLTQFATFCFARRIQFLTLLPELNSEELHRFIHFLVLDPQQLQSRGGLSSLLEKAHITNIWINEQDLDVILEKKRRIEAQPEPDEATIAALLSQESQAQSSQQTTTIQDLKTILKKLQQERDDQKFWQLLQEAIPLIRLNMTDENRELIIQALVLFCRFASTRKVSEARREHSINALRQLTTNELIDFLVAALLLPNIPDKKRQTLTKVLAFLEEKATRRIMSLLSEEKAAANRKHLAAVLIRSGSAAVPILQEYLLDSRWYVVRNAVAILGEIRQQECLVHLTPLLQHKDLRVCRETIRALTKIGGPRAINILLQTTMSGDQELRRQALLSLGAIRAAGAVPTLLKIVKKKSWSRDNVDLRKDAIRSLGEIRSSEAVPVLERTLASRPLFNRQRSDELRTAAATALGDIGDDSARASLEKASHDKSADVARAAAKALKLLDKVTQ